MIGKTGGRCVIRLWFVLPVLVLGSSLTADGWTQKKSTTGHTSRPALRMQTQATGSVSVAFVNLPDGALLAPGGAGQRALDLGQVAYGAVSRTPNVQIRTLKDRMIVTTRFGLALQNTGTGGSFATATVLASLAFPDSARTMRIEGVKMGPVPQIIQPRARLGATSACRFEIEVPVTLTEKDAQMRNSILFQVIPN